MQQECVKNNLMFYILILKELNLTDHKNMVIILVLFQYIYIYEQHQYDVENIGLNELNDKSSI